MKLGQNVCLDNISDEVENGSCQSKTRSICQLIGKPGLHSRGRIFCPILMKLAQNLCLDGISDELKNASSRVKN